MRRRGLGVVSLLLVVVLSGACSNDVVMPDVMGMNKDDYKETMYARRIVDWTEEWREGDKPLKVIYQSPEEGTPIQEDTEIHVTLSGRY